MPNHNNKIQSVANIRQLHCSALFLCGLALAACHRDPPPPQPPKVNVVVVAAGSLPLDFAQTARTRGEREVEVRARVSGILKKRNYRQGEAVAAGALLFEIDPAPFAAAERSARGRLQIEQARLMEASQQRERIAKLFERGISAGRERDLADSAYASARAAVAAAAADLERAKLDLSYTVVRAPVAGLTGAEARSEGSLVTAGSDSSLLTTITQSDRLYVDFALPDAEARLVREALLRDAPAVSVLLRPTGGVEIKQAARIEFLDTRVRAGEGTVEVRAIFDNAAQELSPGQFVRARIVGLHTSTGIFVPSRAVMDGADGSFVWKLDARNIARAQPVVLGASRRNLVQIRQGLVAKDRVVVDGVLKVQADAAVDPLTVALDAGVASDGVQP